MAVFAREIINREVIDSHSQLLGTLRDVVFDKQSLEFESKSRKILIRLHFRGRWLTD